MRNHFWNHKFTVRIFQLWSQKNNVAFGRGWGNRCFGCILYISTFSFFIRAVFFMLANDEIKMVSSSIIIITKAEKSWPKWQQCSRRLSWEPNLLMKLWEKTFISKQGHKFVAAVGPLTWIDDLPKSHLSKLYRLPLGKRQLIYKKLRESVSLAREIEMIDLFMSLLRGKLCDWPQSTRSNRRCSKDSM